MTQWDPNLFHRKGLRNAYNVDYLKSLITVGKLIKIKNKPVIFTLAHLAAHTDTYYKDLHYFVSRHDFDISHQCAKSENKYHYKSFFITKRSGGKREINVPHPILSIAQSWIARNVLKAVPIHESATAYKVKSSIVKNAEIHCNCKWLLKLDLNDFFHNISEKQVFHVFKALGYPRLVSLEMARLCTMVKPRTGKKWINNNRNYSIVDYSCEYIGCLPQGAPTSPALSNVVCFKLDEIISTLALDYNCCYTRYADDLTFSFVKANRNTILEFKNKVSHELIKYGFSINAKKTRIIPPGARKIVTGLVVNGVSPTIPRELRDKVKADLYYAKKFGVANHCKKNKYKSIIGFSNHMFGMISFIRSVDPNLANKYLLLYEELDLPILLV